MNGGILTMCFTLQSYFCPSRVKRQMTSDSQKPRGLTLTAASPESGVATLFVGNLPCLGVLGCFVFCMGDVVLKSHRVCSNHQGNPTGGYFGMLFSGDPHCPMKSWSFFFREEKNSMKAIRGGISWHDIFVIYAKWMVKQVLTKTTRLFRPGYLVDFFRRQFFWQYAFMVLLKSEGWRDIKRLQIWMAQSQFSGIKAAEMPGVDAIGVLHTRIKCVHDICIYCIYMHMQRDYYNYYKQIGIWAWCIFNMYRRHLFSTHCGEDMHTG